MHEPSHKTFKKLEQLFQLMAELKIHIEAPSEYVAVYDDETGDKWIMVDMEARASERNTISSFPPDTEFKLRVPNS